MGELSLDNDLGDDRVYGQGMDVIQFLDGESFAGRDRWPDKITLHTANPYARDQGAAGIERANERHGLGYQKTRTPGGKPHFRR